jgi:SAM-dependent methyltransferase
LKLAAKKSFRKARKLWWLATHGRAAYAAYAVGNRVRGLDFGYVGLDRLGLSADRSVFHTNSGGPELARIVRTLDIPPGTCAVDLGSGKGGAVLTLSRQGYQKVVGVEIAAELVDVAWRNARRARRRNVEFVCCDASKFKDLEPFSHIYMYNPFHEPVMREVLVNIAESLERAPRDLTLIYCNPQHHDLLIESGIFIVAHEGDAKAINLTETTGSRFVVYAHQARSAASREHPAAPH